MSNPPFSKVPSYFSAVYGKCILSSILWFRMCSNSRFVSPSSQKKHQSSGISDHTIFYPRWSNSLWGDLCFFIPAQELGGGFIVTIVVETTQFTECSTGGAGLEQPREKQERKQSQPGFYQPPLSLKKTYCNQKILIPAWGA